MMTFNWVCSPPRTMYETSTISNKFRSLKCLMDSGSCDGFPSFLPKEIRKIKDPYARMLAKRIERLPVQLQFGDSWSCIMSSCVKPLKQSETNPVVLLHSFDSSCLEWSNMFPLLENAGLETWAIDVLGWGFSDLGSRPPCTVASKRYHLYQMWSTYINKPMILVGSSLGAAVAVDFALHYPQAVKKLVLINASIYGNGNGNLANLPNGVAYAGVFFLKSIPLRFYINWIAFCSRNISLFTILDLANVGRLHCLLPWWKDATVSFINSGGYNIAGQIKQVKQQTLIICGEQDQIVSYKEIVRLQCELSNSKTRLIPESGHLPHVEKPASVARLIREFIQGNV